ncbi:hypothetical protein [Roseateles sp. BYS96W]|uniref:Uncharacterized protein n=1 Tax=Pelomonas nitida TaxID=3299027 RepID=A0ABW7GBB9_9BURK
MPTDTRSFPSTQPADPPTAARPRVLEGGTPRPQAPSSTRPTRANAAAAGAAAATRPGAGPRAQGTAIPARNAGLPRWAKGVVIGGVLLAVAMPASVLLSRSMLVQETLAAESGSKAAMVCVGGNARAIDGSSVFGWLFGGSYFSCGDWETREARLQRERDQAQANYLARERAKQGLN